jgi:hypothetical protein
MYQDRATTTRIERLIQEIEEKQGKEGIERMICEMVDQYI